ncbi:MAG: YbfB/YjiJ family MFS transporter [Pseudomonadota bacterium]
MAEKGPEAARAVTIALGGFCALLAAMGIGRFLFTPVLPMMPGLSPAEAGLVASANFAGYLLGALLGAVAWFSARPGPVLLCALALSVLTTGAMVLTEHPVAWGLLRFVAGLASAGVLVTASTLVAARLGAVGRGGLTALHFAGVGAGIAVSAIIASPLIAAAEDWRIVWLGGALAALAGAIAALLLIPRQRPLAAAQAQESAAAPGLWRLVLSYGAVGFGYVILATFIVAILREGGGSRADEAVVWGLVGLAGMPSILLWRWIAQRIGTLLAIQAAMLVEAAGIAIGALAGGAFALGIAATALGATFMALTALGLQEAVTRAPGAAQRVIALMTAAFGLGQIIGPARAGWLRTTTGDYLAPSLIAAAVLVAGMAVLEPLRRAAQAERL